MRDWSRVEYVCSGLRPGPEVRLSPNATTTGVPLPGATGEVCPLHAIVEAARTSPARNAVMPALSQTRCPVRNLHWGLDMELRRTLLSIGLLLLCPGMTAAQVAANPDRTQPDFKVIVQGTFDPETLAEFNRRVSDYAALRARLEQGLPPLVVTTDADEIER